MRRFGRRDDRVGTDQRHVELVKGTIRGSRASSCGGRPAISAARVVRGVPPVQPSRSPTEVAPRQRGRISFGNRR